MNKPQISPELAALIERMHESGCLCRQCREERARQDAFWDRIAANCQKRGGAQ